MMVAWITVSDSVSGEKWLDSGCILKLQPTGVPDYLYMGCKKKKTQDDYKGLDRNNQDRENCV